MKKLFTLLLGVMMATTSMAQQARDIQVIGHRGGRYEFEENTLAAFKGSYAQGVRAYETDIRLTKDGELVVIHDSSLKHMADVDMDVEKSTREQIEKVRTKQGNPILFLDVLADYFSTTEILYIEWEMKSNNYTEEQLKTYCDKIYQTVMSKRPATALYVFSSFDHRALRIMKERHPDAECMLITGDPVSEQTIATTKSLGLRRMACGVDGTSRAAVKQAHKEGLIINLWPGGSIEDFQLALALGADIACTDYPVKVLQFISEKMPWIKGAKNIR